MPGMASRGEAVGQSWFALKKDEFYVILDSVLTEMTKCDERNSVSGCIELIKLLSDNGTTDTPNDKLATRNGSGDAAQADRFNPSQSGNSSGYTEKYDDERNGKLPDCNQTLVAYRSTGRLFDNNAQLSICKGVDYRRHTNKGNHLPSAKCTTRRPRNREKSASRLQRPGIMFSKEEEDVYGRKTSLIGETRDVQASLFHPSRIGPNHGLQDISFNSKCTTDQNGFDAKLSTMSTSRYQRHLARANDTRFQKNSRIPYSASYHDARLSSNRPNSDHRRHQSLQKQTHSSVCATVKAQSFDRNTPERRIRHESASNTQYQTLYSQTNNVAHHFSDTQPDPRSLTPFKLTSTGDRKLSNTTPQASNGTWTPINKTVINSILDDILSVDDVDHTSLQTGLQAPRNSNDVDIRNDDAIKTAGGFVLQTDVKVENQSDVMTDDMRAKLGNNGVIANVKLVDVRRFDVNQMSFKWKSQLLWRMRQDKVSQTPLSSLV